MVEKPEHLEKNCSQRKNAISVLYIQYGTKDVNPAFSNTK